VHLVLDALFAARYRTALIRIIGIGSPFGDDAAGLEVARALAAAPPPNCEVVAADRPGASLIEMLDGAGAAILIDAARSGAPPGTLHEFGFDELERCAAARLVSSHDLGVAAAVALARKLGRAPVRGRILAIEIAPAPEGAPCGLSANAREAAERASIRVRQLADEMNPRARERLLISGTVQGVGFRPFVWRLAKSLGLAGFVRNSAAGVEIEAEGTCGHLCEFRRRLAAEAPPAAAIERIESDARAVLSEKEFRAMPSERGRAATTIPPDLATCPECLREILDPADRRYRYPFTNCTACGPRFTVVRALPYDRDTTTMRAFALCARCEREYLDPADRRFRAEPVACPRCGPRAWLEVCRPQIESAPASTGDRDCIGAAAAILRDGGMLAVQGIGGFHLACDAGNEAAVMRLRAIKRRAHKPLAVMVDSLDAARRFACVADAEAPLLVSPAAPIVLMRKRDDAALAPSLAPGNDHVGVMLAYSPLHHLLIRDAGRALVMTSANLPGEPLARTVEEARAAFGTQVDAILAHDRPIHQRCDDSVWFAVAGGAQPIRLSRGAVPRALAVPVEAPVAILGVGGEIKNSFCILAGRHAMMSQYVGTLENVATQEHFRDSLDKWCALTGIRPALAAHDLHPQSVARELAAQLGVEMVGVQHHHAHVAACLAEHGHIGPAIGIALDGTGYGADGAIWGGEAMAADLRGFQRLSHLEYLPLAGGDAAVRHPARIAASYLLALFGAIVDEDLRARLGDERARVLARMVERRINTVSTSSCGRMFDAVAAILGMRDEVTYEAQAAIELETLARAAPSAARIYPLAIEDGVVRLREMFAAILDDMRRSMPKAQIARAFHDTVAEMVRRMAADARAATGINVVALSGGCFQNRLLLGASIARLQRDGFTVLTHHKVPANDGGLALGQAVIAAARLNAGQVQRAGLG
jgi:hydrogenase maturation protein HypF